MLLQARALKSSANKARKSRPSEVPGVPRNHAVLEDADPEEVEGKWNAFQQRKFKSLNAYNDLRRSILFLSPFPRWGNGSPQGFRNLPKVTLGGCGRAESQTLLVSFRTLETSWELQMSATYVILKSLVAT